MIFLIFSHLCGVFLGAKLQISWISVYSQLFLYNVSSFLENVPGIADVILKQNLHSQFLVWALCYIDISLFRYFCIRSTCRTPVEHCSLLIRDLGAYHIAAGYWLCLVLTSLSVHSNVLSKAHWSKDLGVYHCRSQVSLLSVYALGWILTH